MADATLPIEKQCAKCGETKPISGFYMRRSSGRSYPQSRCKPCFNEYSLARKLSADEKAERTRQRRSRRSHTCLACGLEKPGTAYRRDDKGRRYRRCMDCHTPLAERRSAEWWSSPEGKREQKRRAAEKAGREYVPGRMGPAPKPLHSVQWPSSGEVRAACSAWCMILLTAAPDLDGEFARARLNRQRARWIASRHARRGRERSQSDGSLTTDVVERLIAEAIECAHCGCRLVRRNGRRRYMGNEATLDHVVPLSRGGVHGLTNVVVACASCNFGRHNALLPT